VAEDIRTIGDERAKARYNWRIVIALFLNVVLWGGLITGFCWLTRS